jgi:hypothetical protein
LECELGSWAASPWPFHPERGDTDDHEMPMSLSERTGLFWAVDHDDVRRRDGLGVSVGAEHPL